MRRVVIVQLYCSFLQVSFLLYNMSNPSNYKKRTLILSHDGDSFKHVAEMKRWKEHLVINAKKNHRQDLFEDELDFNLESNPNKYWRPWFRLENSEDTLQAATDEEYKEILRNLIFNKGTSYQEAIKKKRIILTKSNKDDKEEKKTRHWVKLTHPEDEIKLEKMSEDKKNKGADKKRNCIMKIGMIQDEVNPEVKTKEKEEKQRKNPIKRQRTRGTFIRILHNITFNNEEM